MTPLHPDVLAIGDISHAADALADLFDANDPTTPVPSCGDWTMADLVWHLTEVQLFWGHIIGNRPEGPETYDPPTRPADAELSAGLRIAGVDLVELLSLADDDEAAWSWSDDHTVGFTVRRQVHESMVHAIDGFLAVSASVPEIEPLLAADGIDELVTVMLTGTPDWATFRADGGVVELVASDTGDQWALQPGKIIGIEPTSGKELELDGYELDHDTIPMATIEASALDLLLWMWGRADAPATTNAAQIEAAAHLRRTFLAATG